MLMPHVSRLALFAALLALAGAAMAAVPAAALRGASPAARDAMLASPNLFSCDGGRVTLLIDKVNDDYCDCADGTDERGTGACAQSIFFCANVAHVGHELRGSFVNDRVCDCCDGSDEWAAPGLCADTCGALAEESLKGRRQRNRQVIAGAKKKREYIQSAAELRRVAEAELAASEAELALADAKLKTVEAELALLEPQERIAKARKDRVAAAEKAALAAAEAAAKADVALGAGVTDDAALLDDPTSAANTRADSPHDELIQQEPIVETDSDAGSATDAEAAAAEPEPEPESEADLAAVPVGSEDEAIAAADDARSDRDEARRARDKVSSSVDTQRALLALDDGAEHEYFPIAHKCFSTRAREYTYEVCVFKDARQNSASGGSGTLLGKWSSWTPARDKLHFTDGIKCWNGPDRSLVVTLVCGESDELSAVDEPEKCAYTAVLSTPAACSAEHADVTDLNAVLAGVVY